MQCKFKHVYFPFKCKERKIRVLEVWVPFSPPFCKFILLLWLGGGECLSSAQGALCRGPMGLSLEGHRKWRVNNSQKAFYFQFNFSLFTVLSSSLVYYLVMLISSSSSSLASFACSCLSLLNFISIISLTITFILILLFNPSFFFFMYLIVSLWYPFFS